MSWKDIAAPILLRLPSVRRPSGHVPFNKKMLWTASVLAVYFTMTNVGLLGLAQGGSDVFGNFRSILAGGQGSLLQLGIGPIVTASIVLQLLDGADMLPLDTDNDPRDQALYQGLQKFLVMVMVVFTGAPLVFGGGFLPADAQLGAALGIGTFGVEMLIFGQIVLGGIIILFLDEIVSKWGIGSGVGLFIVAGVAQRLIGGVFSQLLPGWYGLVFKDQLSGILSGEGIQQLLFGTGQIIPLITTLLIFAIVVYAESTRVEIPLSNARVKGARGRFPVKLIYASVMPLIFVRAVQANIQFIGRIINQQLGSAMPGWLGVYAQGQPVGGLFYYLAPIQGPQQWMWWLAGATAEPHQLLARVLVDIVMMIIGGAVFAIFWVDTTGMGADATAEQIHNSGMEIPGFRRNTSSMERVLERYIPYLTVLGGILVGLLAILANLLGTIGGVTGTGLLLAISITYKLYEQIAQEKLMEMNSMFRRLFEG